MLQPAQTPTPRQRSAEEIRDYYARSPSQIAEREAARVEKETHEQPARRAPRSRSRKG